ncbi:MAG: sigma-70 family RNA polymerase sigma factor [Clostridia bacterium]|nr:sigma-70 family RNA polymerase sigma factor [Clostridia bacterium]
MTENQDRIPQTTEERMAQARNFLCGYQLCLDMLNLRRYERKRAQAFSDACDCDDILLGNEAFWRARMYEVSTLISSMKNGREKLLLYYHYIRGESVEHAANILGFSRRTGYRLLQKGLLSASFLLEKMKKRGNFDFPHE